jgi:hypothetical protein
MLCIKNTRLRSVPEYRHYIAHSLAENLFLINSPEDAENMEKITMSPIITSAKTEKHHDT